MNDRELLELAAKAAGISVYGPNDYDGLTLSSGSHWNPLTDDGDALRLAVKLSFTVQIEHEDEEEPRTYVVGEHGYCLAVEDHDNDPDIATRRAIVRAAAEVGRAMK